MSDNQTVANLVMLPIGSFRGIQIDLMRFIRVFVVEEIKRVLHGMYGICLYILLTVVNRTHGIYRFTGNR